MTTVTQDSWSGVHSNAPTSASEPSGSFTTVLFIFYYTATTEIYPLSLHDALPISLDRLSASGRLIRFDKRGTGMSDRPAGVRSEEHTSELQSHSDLVCRLLLE